MALNFEAPDPGRMQHQIQIQDPPDGPKDARGHVTGEWVDRTPISAWIQPLRGDELIRSQTVFARATHRVHVYAGQGITEENRFRYRDEIFEIGYVDDVNLAGGRMWLLAVKESK